MTAMNSSPPPPVQIHSLHSSDATELHQAASASRGLLAPWFMAPQSLEAWQAFIALRQGPQSLGFVIRRASNAELVGFMDISNIVRGVFQSGYLSYFAVQGAHGQGFMTLGLRLLVAHAFSELGLHRLEANIRPENVRSIALVKRLGFAQEGYSPRYLKLDGAWRDHERWALLAD